VHRCEARQIASAVTASRLLRQAHKLIGDVVLVISWNRGPVRMLCHRSLDEACAVDCRVGAVAVRICLPVVWKAYGEALLSYATI
jgi:hypothetical protein